MYNRLVVCGLTGGGLKRGFLCIHVHRLDDERDLSRRVPAQSQRRLDARVNTPYPERFLQQAASSYTHI